MLDSDEFLDLARRLADPSAGTPPSDAQLRRAVSTAYYAIFHAALTSAAERFMGAADARRPGYALLYRGFEHGRMRRVCEDVDRPIMGALHQRHLGLPTIDADLRAFATEFRWLTATAAAGRL